MMQHVDHRPEVRIRARMEAVRTAGVWMPWTAAALALLYWGSTGAWIYSEIGIEILLAQPPLTLMTGGMALLTPGLILICAGLMGRESRRSSEANALVLEASRRLLAPAQSAREEAETISDALAQETQSVNKALSDARHRMDELRNELAASAISVREAALLAREDATALADRLEIERENLLALSNDLRAQAENLSRSVPRHAQTLSDAAKAAQDEVRKADEGLDQRLRSIDDAARTLTGRIDQLDAMGAESRKRAQTLASSLGRMEEQLLQSTRMVDAAIRAGELATAASKNTADALKDAMSDALESALKASELIASRSATASEDAARAMLRLKEAGVQAETATRAATLAARAQADETETRINQLSEFLFKSASRATSMAESGLERARQRIERASLLLNQMRDEPSSVEDLTLAPPQSDQPERFRSTLDQSPALQTAFPTGPTFPLENSTGSNSTSEDQAFPGDAILRSTGLSWRELLTGMEDITPEQREETLGNLFTRLEKAGMRPAQSLRASDVRRVATAAHQGSRQRRRVIQDIASGDLQRISRLLESDRELRSAARSFILAEEPEALRVLAEAEKTRDDASPRLSTYLLLDAALGGG
jgi:myosin heavy subunit